MSKEVSTRRGPLPLELTASEVTAGRYHWLVLSVTSVGMLLVGLNASMLNVALPAVVRHFQPSTLEASWIVLSYMLINTVLILVFGRLSDIFGRRSLYIVGFAVFTVASLVLGLSPNILALIALRMVQAAGAAIIISTTPALLTDAFPRHLLSRGLGLNVAVVSIAQVVGPTLGGLVADSAGWSWVFWFNVPIGAVGLLWAAVSLKAAPQSSPREPVDVVGAFLAFVALSSLLLALSEGGVEGWSSPLVIACALIFLGLLPGFLLLEQRVVHPMVDLALFRSWAFAMANLAAFLNSLARFSPVLLIALYLQAADGDSALQAGLGVLPVALGMVIASPIAGVTANRFSARALSTGGMCVSAIGLCMLALAIEAGAAYLPMGLGLGLTGLGAGFFLTSNTTAILGDVPPDRRGIANGLRSMLQNAGMVVSTALSLTIVTAPLKPGAKHQVYAGTLSHLSHSSLSTFSAAYRTAFLVMTAVTLLGAVASFSRGGRFVMVREQLEHRESEPVDSAI